MKKIFAVLAAACIAALPVVAEQTKEYEPVELAQETEKESAEIRADAAVNTGVCDSDGREKGCEEDGMLATLERAYEMRDAIDSIVSTLEDLYKQFEHEKARLRSIHFDGADPITIGFPFVQEEGKLWERIYGLPFPE